MPIYRLIDEIIFPDPNDANEDGILAVGGDLSEERLILAYSMGIFPWYNEGEEILWWSPDPRFVLFPDEIKLSKSLKKVIRDGKFRITYNTSFEKVLANCADVDRPGQDGTWITESIKESYANLHEKGIALSLEVWMDNRLIGGLYGLYFNKVFFGESMFSLESNASKVAFAHLVEKLKNDGCKVIDCQVYTKHLESFGARMIPRVEFLKYLE